MFNTFLDCWNNEPDNRPTIDQVADKLNAIFSKENVVLNDFHSCNNSNTDIQLSNEQLLIENNFSNNSSHEELSQVIQNFNNMSIKEIEPLMLSDNLVINKIVLLENFIYT